jgi:NTE family protein
MAAARRRLPEPFMLSIVPRLKSAVPLAGLIAATAVGAQTPASGITPPGSQERVATASAPPAGPRIGLALSGGGARGLAHVGVLKVLEEMRIPISCVTGTSMGAIVGGTFAAGRSPGEMEKIVVAAPWSDIFRDAPPRKEIAVRRKFDDYKTLFKPEFGVKDGGLSLPMGVIAGVSIEAFFRELATPAFGIGDFNKLPIPFRAMATDIETGQSVVLDHGSLAQAMRASMSVPGAIAPVEIDGRLLVDGGIANNLPINEARKLCADVIIAVNISTPPLKRDELTSALSVTAQLINFLGMQTVDEQIKSLGANDVLISPDLGNISAGTFDRAQDAITIGEQATRALADKLARYSVPPEQFAALRSRQVAEGQALGAVDEIRVEG